jgi:lipoprotein-anchoring transpeptidase ErfK/SrfK
MVDRSVRVNLRNQLLDVLEGDAVVRRFAVSTSAQGPGERVNSLCTPRGWHVIRAKIGASLPENTVFVGRRLTGEIYGAELARQQPGRDWVLTRILWLSGSEPGRNRLGNVDSMRRFIYIHGTPDTEPMGVPRSHGCVRMRNADVIELFDMVDAGMPVELIP